MSDKLLDGTGHPRNHGFAQCSRCGTQRPGHLLAHSPDDSARYLDWLKDGGTAPVMSPAVCVDKSWCDRQSGKATGLDANGDAV